MHRRHHLSGLVLLVASSAMIFGVPALAAQPPALGSQDPTRIDPALGLSVEWVIGDPSPFAGTRFDGQFVRSDRSIYFLGFRTLGDVTDGSVWYYDVPAGAYADTGVDMPVPVSNYGIAALKDQNGLGLYIFGGRDAAAQIVTTVQVYYPATNTAEVLSDDPWPGQTPAGCVSLPANGVVAYGNRAYVLGGLSFAANGCLDDQSAETWAFDPLAPDGSKWSPGPDLNVARGYITPTERGGRIYAVGGDQNSAGSLIPMPTVEAWTPPSGGWDDAGVADLPVPCDESQAFAVRSAGLHRGIVLAGCGQWPNAVPDTYFYDVAGNTWSLVGSLNENRRNHAGALIMMGHRPVMYVLGGYGEASGFIDPIFTSERGHGSTAPELDPSDPRALHRPGRSVQTS
ncbi:hypothetical protein BH20ACT24_BH20ACT24_02210 [soil metagenome]